MNKVWIFLGISLFSSLFAEFDPSPEARKKFLEDSSYKALKERVIDSLANTWCSAEKASLIMDFIASEKPKVCVEIGVFTGSSFLPIAASLEYFDCGTVYAVDPWSNEENVRNLDLDDPARSWWEKVEMNHVLKSFIDKICIWNLHHYKIVRLTAKEAVGQIGEIDFIHFDGNFSKESSMEDVALYLPKVRPGGYILFSNVNHTSKGSFTRIDALLSLFDTCISIEDVDNGNTYLLRKLTAEEL